MSLQCHWEGTRCDAGFQLGTHYLLYHKAWIYNLANIVFSVVRLLYTKHYLSPLGDEVALIHAVQPVVAIRPIPLARELKPTLAPWL